MTRMKLTVCNRCRHVAKEDDFEGMDVQIFDQGGCGSGEDSFTLCDPCIEELRKWLVTKPVPDRFAGIDDKRHIGVVVRDELRIADATIAHVMNVPPHEFEYDVTPGTCNCARCRKPREHSIHHQES